MITPIELLLPVGNTRPALNNSAGIINGLFQGQQGQLGQQQLQNQFPQQGQNQFPQQGQNQFQQGGQQRQATPSFQG